MSTSKMLIYATSDFKIIQQQIKYRAIFKWMKLKKVLFRIINFHGFIYHLFSISVIMSNCLGVNRRKIIKYLKHINIISNASTNSDLQSLNKSNDWLMVR